MSHPPALRKLAADAPLFRFVETTTWQAIVERGGYGFDAQDRMRDMAYRTAAAAITSKFMADVMKRMAIEQRDTADGREVSFTCCALRYDQLMDLLYAAYVEGQRSVRSMPMLEVRP